MEKVKTVTIITPTYNKFENIQDVLESVVNQNYEDIEYIICDDGSRDFPHDEIAKYVQNNKKDNIKRFLIIHNEKNLGTVKNLNNAISKSTGDIIMFLSGDDVFFAKDVVSKIVERFNHNGCELLVTSRYCVDDKGNFQGYLPHVADRKKICSWTSEQQHDRYLMAMYRNMASGSVLCFKRSAFERMGGYDERYILWEDGPFIHKYTRNHEISCCYDIISIKYRVDGISGNPNSILLQDGVKYNELELKEDIDNKNWFVKECIRCRFERSSRSIIYLVFRYPLVLLMFFYETLRTNLLTRIEIYSYRREEI